MFLNKNSIGGKMLSIMLVAAMVSSVAEIGRAHV